MPEIVHRNARVRPPAPARTTFEIPPLPVVEPRAKLQAVHLLVPVLGSLSILVYGVMARTAVLLVTGGITALASLASPLLVHWLGKRAQRARFESRRGRFRFRLSELRAAVEQAKEHLRIVLADPHPVPGRYDDWLDAGRLWERCLDDLDMLDVQLGTADVATDFRVNRPSWSAESEPDAELAAEADALDDDAGALAKAPLVLRLAEGGVVAVTGDRAGALGLVRTMVIELALSCAPDDLSLVAAFPPAETTSWDWLKWLPHTAGSRVPMDRRRPDRLLATTGQDLERLLEQVVGPRLLRVREPSSATALTSLPRVVIVIDRFDPLSELGLSRLLCQSLANADIGVAVIALCDQGTQAPGETTAIISAGSGGGTAGSSPSVLRRLAPPAPPVSFSSLSVAVHEAEGIARLLAPKRLVGAALRGGRDGGPRLTDLLTAGLLAPDGVAQQRCSGAPGWPAPARQRFLRVPVGVSAGGAPLELDLKEAADGGNGPHGLVIGAVGSGKSELLRTLVGALAATHAPDDVEFAFVDFKGGLTFAPLEELPHCSGMITNLAQDVTLVDRMKAALTGELERRQQQLRSAGGDVQKIGQYRALRAGRAELPPMPFLVVVVDEFGELLEVRPDVLDVLLSIGRTGRSLGVHLLLASQRPEPGRTRGLDSYLGYRICLRTYTAEDSSVVLGSRAAADLPADPGHGYLRTGAALTRFTAATVSLARAARETSGSPVRRFVIGQDVAARSPDLDSTPEASDIGPANDDDETDLALVLRESRRAAAGHRRPPLWLPPLPRPDEPGRLTLGDPRLGEPTTPSAGGLPVPVGLVDLPVARVQVPLVLDAAALDGHLLVVGAPQTGKSTALAAYAIQAARLHPASLLQFHVIDLGGGALAPLEALPNVGAYAGTENPDGIRRIVIELERRVDGGPALMRHRAVHSGVHSTAGWREGVARDVVRGPVHTVLLLDQLVSFRERFPDLDAALGRLLLEGPGAGVHVAVTSSRWADLPSKRLEHISARIELRLNDVLESQHGRVAAASLPVGVAGRGLVASGAVVQLAAVGEPPVPVDLAAAVGAATALARRRWPDVTAEPLRRIADLTTAEWAQRHEDAVTCSHMLVGVSEAGLEAVTAEHGGLAVLSYGDPGSGRSRFLSRLITETASLPEHARPQVYVLDYLGALLERCRDAKIAAAAYGPEETPDVLGALADELIRRRSGLAAARRIGGPPPPAAPIWLVADDYELVHAAARPGLVSELANLVPYAARLRFGLLLNQAANGSGARVDPLVRRLLEAAPWHLRFAVESRLELLLTGTRGSPLPPGQAVLTRPGRPDALVALLPPVVPGDVEAPEPRPDPRVAPPDGGAQDGTSQAARPQIRLVS
jgi:S-DNA-T family DNA segregation ATPase FtsK/SpoIIIE